MEWSQSVTANAAPECAGLSSACMRAVRGIASSYHASADHPSKHHGRAALIRDETSMHNHVGIYKWTLRPRILPAKHLLFEDHPSPLSIRLDTLCVRRNVSRFMVIPTRPLQLQWKEREQMSRGRSRWKRRWIHSLDQRRDLHIYSRLPSSDAAHVLDVIGDFLCARQPTAQAYKPLQRIAVWRERDSSSEGLVMEYGKWTLALLAKLRAC